MGSRLVPTLAELRHSRLGQGWYLTYHYWPVAANEHVFEGTLYFVPAETARERVAHENAAVTFKEFGLQDANTLEAPDDARVTGDRAVPPDGPGSPCRHMHKVANEWGTTTRRSSTRRYEPMDATVAERFSDLEPFADTWCLATERERFAARLASTMDEMQALYDAAMPGPTRP